MRLADALVTILCKMTHADKRMNPITFWERPGRHLWVRDQILALAEFPVVCCVIVDCLYTYWHIRQSFICLWITIWKYCNLDIFYHFVGIYGKIIFYFFTKHELSYRKQIARKLRTQNVEGIYRDTQGHWKQNHWIDHTRLTISRINWRWIISWPWNVG